MNVQLVTIPFLEDGSLDMKFIKENTDDNTAAVLVQYPNFFGGIDDVKSVGTIAKSKGALLVVCANPLVYGLYASAGELGADIAVGDSQPFGLPLQYGGPYVGYLACKSELVRQMPGRLVGETVDTEGKRGFVLTLQTREQHIRREKATSNICTNQALAALASLVSILWYGKEGVAKLALTNYQRANYLREQLIPYTEKTPFANSTIFNEFVIKCKKPTAEVLAHFRKNGIEAGIDLSVYFPSLKKCILACVTETKSKDQLERYVEVMKKL